MSEPLLERLSRFTPDAGGLDRDALLFAAGRDSARPNRGWMTLAAVLTTTQALSLVLLWPHSTPPTAALSVPIATAPERPPAKATATTEALANPGVWSARYSLLESDPEDRPDVTVNPIESEPPLRPSGPVPASILN
jgi:hypothetical protein